MPNKVSAESQGQNISGGVNITATTVNIQGDLSGRDNIAVSNTSLHSVVDSATNSYNDLDRNVYAELKIILPYDKSICYIREHDFGGSFWLDRLDDFYNFSRRCETDPGFEFMDVDLEKLRASLFELVSEFVYEIGMKTSPLNFHRDKVLSAVHRPLPGEGWAAHHANVKRINDLADSIVQTYDELIRVGRRNLGV